MRNHTAILAACLLGSALIAAAPAQAQRGWGGGYGGWNGEPYDNASRQGPVEGHVDVARFAADGADARLGHGPMTVVASPQTPPSPDADAHPSITPSSITSPSISGAPGSPSSRDEATYQAAVVDALARAGYQIAVPLTARIDPVTGQFIHEPVAPGQITEVSLTRDIAVPQEAPHKPVSGAMSMGVSNYGSGMGLALNIDLSKPKKALIATRLSLRIRDRDTGAALWEGRAEIITREGNDRWNDNAIAAALAKALFAGFPQAR